MLAPGRSGVGEPGRGHYPAEMPDFHIREASLDRYWGYERLHELDVAISIEQFGEDLSPSAHRVQIHHSDERTSLKCLLVALPGPVPADAERGRFGLPLLPQEPLDLLGSAEFGMPILDNRHLLDDLFVQVRTDVRGGGIGSALWREVVRIAGEHHRDTIIGWTNHLATGQDPALGRLAPATGVGHVPLDAAARFARSHQLALEQVERQSRLDLPVDPKRLVALRAEAEARALPAYRVASWIGPTPAEYRDLVAAMNRTLSVDAPIGEVDWQPESWDAERVRHTDERLALSGRSVYSLAIANSTGEAAGLSHIQVEEAHPERPEQWNTVVAQAHRGHRLGLLLKVANLQQLADAVPQARHMDTWNAGENEFMLAINTALGYRLYAVSGTWQLRL